MQISINFFNTHKIKNLLILIQNSSFVLLPFFIFTGPFFSDLAITLIAIIFLCLSFKKKIIFQYKIFILTFLIYWFFLLISSLYSEYILYTFVDTFLYIRFLFFVLGCVEIIKRDLKLLKYFCFVLSSTFILALFDGYYQYFLSEGITGFKYNNSRLSNFITGELILGSYLSRLFPLVIMLNIFFYKNNIKLIYLLSIIIVLVDVLIYLSGERAAFFYLLISIILIILMINKFALLRLATFLVSLVLIFFISINNTTIKDRMIDQTFNDLKLSSNINLDKLENNNVENDNPISLDNKDEKQNFFEFPFFDRYNAFTHAHNQLYLSSINIFLNNNLFFGIGVENFRHECKKDIYITQFGDLSCSTHPHNTYIQLLTETGIFGFFIVLLVFLYSSLIILKQIYINLFSKGKNLNDIQIGAFISLFISLWPLIPTGNFFNNWLSIIYFLPFIFIIEKYEN